jgi:hypothetical protein
VRKANRIGLIDQEVTGIKEGETTRKGATRNVAPYGTTNAGGRSYRALRHSIQSHIQAYALARKDCDHQRRWD